MRAVVQRVRSASVTVDGRETARIGPGLLVLAGFAPQDTPQVLSRMASRLVCLRIFDDEAGRLNRSLKDIAGELLLIPQVTLTSSLAKGTRPSFHTAAAPDAARERFDGFVQAVKSLHPHVVTGVFQAHMLVRLENEGPVTFVLDE